MLESQANFNLVVRSETTLALARSVKLAQDTIRAQSAYKAAAANLSEPALAGTGASNVADLLTSTTISPAAKLKAFLKDVLDKTDDNIISDAMLKRLEEAKKSDNKQVAAERLREAKAKLQALRTQAQAAAASGDPKLLRRIAQEVAQAAREVADAARGLASGVAATALTADSSTSSTVPAMAAAPAAQAASDADATTDGQSSSDHDASSDTAASNGENPLLWGSQALQKLSDDAHTAIAQARGLIAFLAEAARAARKHRPDLDEDKAYNDLQRAVSDADADVTDAIGDAGKEITDGSSFGAMDSADTAVVESTTIEVDTSVEMSAGATAAG